MLVELRVGGGFGDKLDTKGRSYPMRMSSTEFLDLPASEVGSSSSGFNAPHISEWTMSLVVDLIIGANAVLTKKDIHLRLVSAVTITSDQGKTLITYFGQILLYVKD